MSFLRVGKNRFRLMWFIEEEKNKCSSVRRYIYGCVKCNELMVKADCVNHECEALDYV